MRFFNFKEEVESCLLYNLDVDLLFVYCFYNCFIIVDEVIKL